MSGTPYTQQQRNAVFATSIVSTGIAVAGAFLLWRYSPLPLGAVDLFFYLQILVAPIAVLLGLISLWMHHTVLHDLRYITFALALSYTTQSSYSVGVFRTSSPSFKPLIGFIASYLALFLVLMALGGIMPLLAPPQPNMRARRAVISYVVAAAFGVAGCALLWWQDSVISPVYIYDITVFRTTLYNDVTVPTIVNLVVLFGAAITQNLHAAYGSLLIVGSSCFWILNGAFELQGSIINHNTAIIILGGVLCWVSGIVSVCASLIIVYNHVFSPEKTVQSLDKRRVVFFVISCLCIATGAGFLFRFDHPQSLSSLEVSGRQFMDFSFCAILLLSVIGHAVAHHRYSPSIVHYLVLGATAYLLTSANSTHSAVNVASNIQNWLHNQGDALYTSHQVKYIAIGEISSYTGLFVLLTVQSGKFGKCSSVTGVYFLSLVIGFTGCMILLFTDGVLDFADVEQTEPTTMTTMAIQQIVVPTALSFIFAFYGIMMSSTEAIHSAFFTIAYYGVWTLPYLFQVRHYVNGNSYLRVTIAGSLCFGSIVILILTLIYHLHHRITKMVRIYLNIVQTELVS